VILRLRPEAYAVAPRKELKTRTGREYTVGAIYAALNKLERKSFQNRRDDVRTRRSREVVFQSNGCRPGRASQLFEGNR
jgi:DNA-binding PadR family transcriptional regulator